MAVLCKNTCEGLECYKGTQMKAYDNIKLIAELESDVTMYTLQK